MKKVFCFVMCLMIFFVANQTIVKAIDADAHDVSEKRNSRIVFYTKGISEKELLSADVFAVNYENLDQVAPFSKQLIDNGSILFISAPEESVEDISKSLSIPINVRQTYQSLPLMAYYFFKVNDKYFATPIYAVFAEETASIADRALDISSAKAISPSSESACVTTSFDSVTFLREDNVAKHYNTTIDPKDAISYAITVRDEITSFISSVEEIEGQNSKSIDNSSNERGITMPSANFSEAWNNDLYVYGRNNKLYGYVRCGVYAYQKGRAIVNGKSCNIYDVLSTAKAYPKQGYYVGKYDVMIHCNVTNFVCLDTTTLPSGITYTQQVGLTGSFTAVEGLGGSVSFNTSWSYNPESQIITESSSHPRVVYWNARTVNAQSGKSYDISPGMRVASPVGKMRGAFSTFYCDALFMGITIKTNSLSLGDWF